MAVPTKTLLRADGLERYILDCRFWPNGDDAPTTVYGAAAVTYVDNSGVWTVTFKDAAVRVVGASLTAGGDCAGATAAGMSSVAITHEGDGAVIVATVTHPDTADIAANAANWYSLVLFCEGSSTYAS